MSKHDFLYGLQTLGKNILPVNAHLWLYGSRARHEELKHSDWDLLILLDKPKEEVSDFDRYSYPFIEYGANNNELVSAHIYTKNAWESMSFTPFYHNVEQDKQILI